MNTDLHGKLRAANLAFNQKYPGDSGARQPVHVVYGGGNLFKAETCVKLAAMAVKAFDEYAPTPEIFESVFVISGSLAPKVHARVGEKLRREAIEDYRIDFEDGYGIRADAEEDGHADTAAKALARAHEKGMLSPFSGIRVKPLNEELKERSLRTLDRFFKVLLAETGGTLPQNFVVTLPKITVPEQVETLMHAISEFPAVNVELMMETPQSLENIGELVDLAKGRCVAIHFGPYDYTSALGITSARQSLMHPACDYARMRMQTLLAGRGLRISDGPTTLLPIAPHKGDLTADQLAENKRVVYKAWRLHYENVNHALDHGIYQGWDLHPAQLVARYAALYAFFLEGIDSASQRLRNFMQAAAQATRIGSVFDDAATGQGLLNYVLRAISSGALNEKEVLALTDLTLEQLRTASFTKIIKPL